VRRSIEQPGTANEDIAWLRRYAWLLDSSVRLPFGRTIGIGSLLGVVPFIGDALGAGLAAIVVLRARQLGVSNAVQIRMLANIAADTLIGAVPLAGDLFDFAFKANQRNVELLGDWARNHEATSRRSRRFLLAGVAVFVATVVIALSIIVLLLKALLGLLG
jgi:hypothetical protein